MTEFITKDFVHEISEQVFNDGGRLVEQPHEYLISFSNYLVERLEQEQVRPLIDDNLFQCQCLTWLGMSAIQRGYCPSCTRPIRIAIGRLSHE